MVAYTTNFCLPHFEGTDSPCLNTGTICEPSTVWCDFIAGVEEQLNGIDEILGRTALALPIGFISYQPTTAVAVADQIPFDTVLIDTDQMVDLEFFRGVIPRRNGVYLIDAVIKFSGATNDERVGAHIKVGNVTIPVGFGNPIRVATAISRGETALGTTDTRASIAWLFNDSGPTPRTISVVTDISRPVTYASLSVYWHSEAS